jgi:hypothetical protein
VDVNVTGGVSLGVWLEDCETDALADALADPLDEAVHDDVPVRDEVPVIDGVTDADGLKEFDGELDGDCDDEGEPDGVMEADGLLLDVCDDDAVCVGVRVGVTVAVSVLDGVRDGVWLGDGEDVCVAEGDATRYTGSSGGSATPRYSVLSAAVDSTVRTAVAVLKRYSREAVTAYSTNAPDSLRPANEYTGEPASMSTEPAARHAITPDTLAKL